MRPVHSGEVLGRSLVEIRQNYTMNPDMGLDEAWSYMLLDSGLVIALRSESIVSEAMPADAGPIEHPCLLQVYGQRIESAQLAPDDLDAFEGYHETPYLAFANGWLITDVPVAPHGVDGVGIAFFEPGEIDTSKFQSLW